MSKPSCSSCRYFISKVVGNACRRYPPIMFEGEGNEPFFVTTEPNWWCGEYVSNKPVARKTQERGKRLIDFLEGHEDYNGESAILGEWMPDEFLTLALEETVGTSIDEDSIWEEWRDFTNYFMHNKDAKNPVKKDWLAAWRNWIRRSKT